jgi:hypothetical protein
MPIPSRALVAVTLCVALLGCGGGGDDDSPATGPTAEGVYGGTLTGSPSRNFQLLVLENDEAWAIYGTQTSTSFLVAGFVQGVGASKSGSFTSSNARDFGFSPAASGTVNATYDAAAKTVSGLISGTAGNVTFNGGPVAGSLYDYNTPAQLSAAAGAWSLTALTGEDVSLNVSAAGALTAISEFGCRFTGTLTPRPSGKNVFNVALTFGASPCVLAGQPATGIAIIYPLASGRVQIVFAGFNSARTIGTAAFGTR